MSKFYIANENGDWWTMDTETGQGLTLFVISEADLKKARTRRGNRFRI